MFLEFYDRECPHCLKMAELVSHLKRETGIDIEQFLRGGFGIGFERFIGFLLNSNDILETIAYRTLQPA